MKATLALILAVTCLSGCSQKYTEVGKTQQNQAFIINSSPTFLGYEYLGSDESHHYFVARWKYGSDKRFKMKTADLAVNKPMPLGKGTVTVLPFASTDPQYEEFGKIGDRVLFRKK
jgi:hypothetical protein